jgi:hypothetical protein
MAQKLGSEYHKFGMPTGVSNSYVVGEIKLSAGAFECIKAARKHVDEIDHWNQASSECPFVFNLSKSTGLDDLQGSGHGITDLYSKTLRHFFW